MAAWLSLGILIYGVAAQAAIQNSDEDYVHYRTVSLIRISRCA
jgi:hypothetical protein